MKLDKIISVFLIAILFFGCTSVPEVRNARQVEFKNGVKVYDVSIEKAYMEKPEELRYAINSFVKEQGGTSYNVEQHGQNDFLITIPGEIPVEDLAKVKHFDVASTTWLVLLTSIPTTIAIFVATMISIERRQQD
jgi:hypothetical protein